MKMLNAALIIALTLTSSVALAERGSSEDNRIVSPESTSTTQYHSEAQHSSFSNLKYRNRSLGVALAERGLFEDNRVRYTDSAPEQQFSFSNLKHRNR